MSQLPQTGAVIQLDSISGWQATTVDLSPAAPTGLTVDCVTGQPSPFVKDLADQLSYPIALAHRLDHELYLLDDGVNRVRMLDLKQQERFVTIDGFGGHGTGIRTFHHPRGLALFEDGSYVVADTGNHQVKLFSVYPNALLSVWGSGQPGSAANEFNKPRKVAVDRCGLIYIADSGNGRVQRIRRDGGAEAPLTGFQNPTSLALARDGTLAVLDGTDIYIYRPSETTGTKIQDSVPSASCLTFDNSGYLYIGTATGLVYKYAAATNGSYRQLGIGVTGINARFLDLLWTEEAELIGLLLPQCASQPLLVTISVCGSYSPLGTLTTFTLDSGIENCVWDRVQLSAVIPPGTVVKASTQTAASDIWSSSTPFQPECSTYSPMNQNCPLVLTGNNPDCLVQSLPGRYLRLQLELHTNRIVSPLLTGIQVSYPRSSYLQYLPAVYQEDDQSRLFLDRFLRIFQTTFDNFDRTIDRVSTLFDPLSVPDTWFNWLAAWIALPQNPLLPSTSPGQPTPPKSCACVEPLNLWTDQQRRTALKSTGRLYPLRGTSAGVQEFVYQYSGVTARIIEHYRLRQLIILSDEPGTGVVLGAATRLWSRDYYRRLQIGVYSRVGYFNLTGEPEPDLEPLAWGANEFTLLFDCDPYQAKAVQQNVSQVVEREKPAHTKANYAPVLPRMRIGVQATLGIDTRIGEYTPLLLGTTGILDYDSILSCSKTESQLQSQQAPVRPRVDVDTRLL